MRILVAKTEEGMSTDLCCAWLCAHSQFSYYKPIRQFNHNPYKFIHSLSPKTKCFKSQFLLTKKNLQQPIEIKDIEYPTLDNVIIDAPNSLMSSLNSYEFVIDWLEQCKSPLILVVSAKAGRLNHNLLNIETIRRRHIPLIGIVVDGTIPSYMQHALEYFGQVKILAKLDPSRSWSETLIRKIPLSKYLQKNLIKSVNYI